MQILLVTFFTVLFSLQCVFTKASEARFNSGNDFIATSGSHENPNLRTGWAYGRLVGGVFETMPYLVQPLNAWGNTVRGYTSVYKFDTPDCGIEHGQLSINSDAFNGAVEWTALWSGLFHVNIAIGGSRAMGSFCTGNANANLGRFSINGAIGQFDSFDNNVAKYQGTVWLEKGHNVLVWVGQNYGSGNTMVKVDITGAPQTEAGFCEESLGGGWELFLFNGNGQYKNSLRLGTNIYGIGDIRTMPTFGGHKMSENVFRERQYTELVAMDSTGAWMIIEKPDGSAITPEEAFAVGHSGALKLTPSDTQVPAIYPNNRIPGMYGPLFGDPFGRGHNWMWNDHGGVGDLRKGSVLGLHGDSAAIEWKWFGRTRDRVCKGNRAAPAFSLSDLTLSCAGDSMVVAAPASSTPYMYHINAAVEPGKECTHYFPNQATGGSVTIPYAGEDSCGTRFVLTRAANVYTVPLYISFAGAPESNFGVVLRCEINRYHSGITGYISSGQTTNSSEIVEVGSYDISASLLLMSTGQEVMSTTDVDEGAVLKLMLTLNINWEGLDPATMPQLRLISVVGLHQNENIPNVTYFDAAANVGNDIVSSPSTNTFAVQVTAERGIDWLLYRVAVDVVRSSSSRLLRGNESAAGAEVSQQAGKIEFPRVVTAGSTVVFAPADNTYPVAVQVTVVVCGAAIVLAMVYGVYRCVMKGKHGPGTDELSKAGNDCEFTTVSPSTGNASTTAPETALVLVHGSPIDTSCSTDAVLGLK